ncbi:hypothetical protein JKP88DRAFT_264791 [Tribonema minus]|uniref:Toprim domain-containing protein n=1 Tax=Tribonema minus TaxID=303371 RepID=A0A835YNG0_9STRA|nr:hypothetical protein JKP88DRAFT_264791 [Tribonema minus]
MVQAATCSTDSYWRLRLRSQLMVRRLKQLASNRNEIIMATEDREAEAISWHLVQALQPKVPISSTVFHKITGAATANALAAVGDIEYTPRETQEAHHDIDRIRISSIHAQHANDSSTRGVLGRQELQQQPTCN